MESWAFSLVQHQRETSAFELASSFVSSQESQAPKVVCSLVHSKELRVDRSQTRPSELFSFRFAS